MRARADISIVLVFPTSRTIFLMQLPNNTGVDITFLPTNFKHRGFLVVVQSCFIKRRKKIVEGRVVFPSLG